MAAIRRIGAGLFRASAQGYCRQDDRDGCGQIRACRRRIGASHAIAASVAFASPANGGNIAARREAKHNRVRGPRAGVVAFKRPPQPCGLHTYDRIYLRIKAFGAPKSFDADRIAFDATSIAVKRCLNNKLEKTGQLRRVTKHLAGEDFTERATHIRGRQLLVLNYPLHRAMILLWRSCHGFCSWLGAGTAHQRVVQGAEVFGTLHNARRFRVPIRAGLCPLLRVGIVSLPAAAGIGRGGVVAAVDIEFIITFVVALAAG
jgi:hypothetical protein